MPQERSTEPTATRDPSSDDTRPSPIRLKLLEKYRDVEIYHLGFEARCILDRELEEEQAKAICAIPSERFGLVVCMHNIALCPSYGSAEQAQGCSTPEMQALRHRIVGTARYSPDSLSVMVRSMAAHLTLRQTSGFAPDLDSALRAVRRAIDADLGKARQAEPPRAHP
jgi:hypothetical protein